ncbi:phosphoribosyl-AMP cyclohydrolase, partial [Candidatus Margulisiibacteriota bacterium]
RNDCDADAILAKIEQVGNVACHTGKRSCFFNKLQ